jgi:hypothetical protein
MEKVIIIYYLYKSTIQTIIKISEIISPNITQSN